MLVGSVRMQSLLVLLVGSVPERQPCLGGCRWIVVAVCSLWWFAACLFACVCVVFGSLGAVLWCKT